MQRSAVLVCLALLACGGKSTPEAPPVASYPPPGAPITGLSTGTWSWVDFPDSACDDGSATGIGVSPGSGPDLLVFLNGGGACWDYLTCYTANLATHGPFGATQLQALLAAQGPGSILDRSLVGHPMADATLVLVPYCTGDIHGGDNVITYVGPAETRVHHHVGRRNVLAFLRRLAATFPAPRRLVVSGSSAGGFGALINYDAFRHYWPAASGFLVDDSGPPLGAGASPQLLQTAWFANWQLGKALDPICGTACRTDLSAQIPALSRAYPQDRLALLSSLQDDVISRYYVLSRTGLQAELLRVTADVIGPTPNFRAFLVAGTSHTMLGDPAAFSQGVPLLDWLGQQVSGDVAWRTRQP